MKAAVLWVSCALLLAACIDSVAPRPRPGGETGGIGSNDTVAMLYYELQPRVISQGLTDSVRITMFIKGNPEFVGINARNGNFYPLLLQPNGTYTVRLPASVLLFGYRTGDLHNAVGFIDIATTKGALEYNLIVNVKDASVPFVDVQTIATGMQTTTHVLNIRYDSLYLGGAVPPALLKSFYSRFADSYTFVTVIEQVQSIHERSFTGVRNQVQGLGLPLFDKTGTYGSSGALEGIVNYPLDASFDLAETGNIHDLAHRWMNYLTLPTLSVGQPHWPLSDLGFGVLGWTDPQTHEPLVFPFDVLPQANGTWLLRLTDSARTFNDLELYLMGLVTPEEVSPHIVFRNQAQRAQVRTNGVLQGPVDSVTMAAIIARDGARKPAAADAPHSFQLATIVLSRGGVLTRDEMAFFEYMAARGEAHNATIFFNGFLRGTTLPFYAATLGRATLVTTLKASN